MNDKLKIICFLLLLSVACKNNLKSNDKDETKSNREQVIQEKEVLDSLRIIDEEINVDDIKQKVSEFTSTYLTKDDSNYDLTDLKDDEYVGLYYLIVGKEKKRKDLVGSLAIYNSEKPWTSDNSTDKFLEINLWKKGLSILRNKVEVGNDRDFLTKYLGDSFVEKNNTLIYSGKDYTWLFKLENDKICYIKVGKYKRNINYNILIDEMKRN